MRSVVLHAVLLVAPVIVAFAIAAATAMGLARVAGPLAESNRLVSLDGLRGYLALGVFLHHAMLWRGYVQPAHAWSLDALQPLYVHLGHSSVTLFFLMTGFLFGAKLASGRERPIDWQRLYVSRVLRIFPLYGVALVGVLLCVGARTGFRLQVPPLLLSRGILSWAHFGTPDLNGVHDTRLMVAGVTWSLAYEWLFYSALPLAAALFFGARPALRWLVASAVGVAVWRIWLGDQFAIIHLGAFGGGVLASLLTRSARVRAALAGHGGAGVALLAGATVVVGFRDAYAWPVLLLLTIAFTIIASGNTLWGVLGTKASRLLGEMSYSLYLLHGLVLYVVLRGIVGMPVAAALSPLAYWGLVLALVPVLVLVAFTTFRLVERPAIRATPHVQRWLAERGPARALARLGSGGRRATA